jgi:hypothetical protein
MTGKAYKSILPALARSKAVTSKYDYVKHIPWANVHLTYMTFRVFPLLPSSGDWLLLADIFSTIYSYKITRQV